MASEQVEQECEQPVVCQACGVMTPHGRCYPSGFGYPHLVSTDLCTPCANSVFEGKSHDVAAAIESRR